MRRGYPLNGNCNPYIRHNSGYTSRFTFICNEKRKLLENKWVFSILNIIINTIRPVPFIIFLVALSPLTRSVIGTTIGTAAAIFPMTLVASIGIARMVETNLVSVPKGVIEARKQWAPRQLELFLKSLYQKR